MGFPKLLCDSIVKGFIKVVLIEFLINDPLPVNGLLILLLISFILSYNRFFILFTLLLVDQIVL
jgi:hypothetical protein